MRSSVIGTFVFIAIYIGVCSLLFGWTPASSWRLFAVTALLHFAVTEFVRRRRKPTQDRSR